MKPYPMLPPMRELMRLLLENIIQAVEEGDEKEADFRIRQLVGASLLYITEKNLQEEKPA